MIGKTKHQQQKIWKPDKNAEGLVYVTDTHYKHIYTFSWLLKYY